MGVFLTRLGDDGVVCICDIVKDGDAPVYAIRGNDDDVPGYDIVGAQTVRTGLDLAEVQAMCFRWFLGSEGPATGWKTS